MVVVGGGDMNSLGTKIGDFKGDGKWRERYSHNTDAKQAHNFQKRIRDRNRRRLVVASAPSGQHRYYTKTFTNDFKFACNLKEGRRSKVNQQYGHQRFSKSPEGSVKSSGTSTGTNITYNIKFLAQAIRDVISRPITSYEILTNLTSKLG